jgi:hypothetical protein
MLVQLAAAFLLLLGSGLIFRALLEIEAPSRTRPTVRSRPHPDGSSGETPLGRAA